MMRMPETIVKEQNHGHIHVEHVEPCEQAGRQLFRCKHGTLRTGPVGAMSQRLIQRSREVGRYDALVFRHLYPTRFVRFPVVQPADGADVREAGLSVIVRQMGVVDAGDGESAGTQSPFGVKVGKYALAHLQIQQFGCNLGNQHLIGGLCGRESGQLAFNEIFVQESGVVVFSDAAELHAAEILAGLEKACLRGEELGMCYAFRVTDDTQHAVIRHDGQNFVICILSDAQHLQL